MGAPSPSWNYVDQSLSNSHRPANTTVYRNGPKQSDNEPGPAIVYRKDVIKSALSGEVPRTPLGCPENTAAAAGTTATDTEEDSQSVSTVSGSGIDFFRKFVQRKGSGCKDCEDQFRREVLIDRLVADSLHSKALLMGGGGGGGSCRTSASSGH
jgi:hypothetical protein